MTATTTRYEVYRHDASIGVEISLTAAYVRARMAALATPGSYVIEREGACVATLRSSGASLEVWIR